MKSLLANLGFVLQISGTFMVIPIFLSIYFNETNTIIAFFITAIVFLILGFFLNTLCERREMNYRESSALFVLVFIILSLIGSIPYLHIFITSTENFIEGITNSVFESCSGFTTTGFSMFTNLSNVPKSIIFYRSLTQFIGGIGIVLILLAFFYPDAKLKDFSKIIGLGKNQKIKKTLILILTVYCSYAFIMIIAGLLFGYYDIINLSSFIMSALSTGGFAPINNIENVVTQYPLNYIIIITMILGATNFLIVVRLFKGKIKEFILSELSILIIIIIFSILITKIYFNLTLFDSTFHVISASSTTGFGYLSDFSDNLKLFFVLLMFIGGSSLSTAGGIKIYRLVLIFKSIKKVIVDKIQRQDNTIKLFGEEYNNHEIIRSLSVVLLMFVVIFISSLILTYYGFKFIDSIFETTSAVANCGLTTGMVSPSLAFELKWFFIIIMILGRVEIITFLRIFSRKKEY